MEQSEKWVALSTLNPGNKFHIIKAGHTIQHVKLKNSFIPNAVNIETGEEVYIDPDVLVFPIDAGWIAEISCYGIEIPENVKGCREVLAYVFSQCRKTDDRWREEIEKYFPELAVMSWSGPERTISWLIKKCKEEK